MLGALMQGMNDRQRDQAEAVERRMTRFVEERRAVYVRYLAAFAEREPLRAEAWRLREEFVTAIRVDPGRHVHRWLHRVLADEGKVTTAKCCGIFMAS
jgi:hypothetical protein